MNPPSPVSPNAATFAERHHAAKALDDIRVDWRVGPAVDAHRLVRLANEGEPRAVKILDGIGRHLGAGIGSLVNIFNPELVVIGGGFAAAGDFILDPAREIVAREGLAGAGKRVRIVRAELGTSAGLIGAGLVAFDALA